MRKQIAIHSNFCLESGPLRGCGGGGGGETGDTCPGPPNLSLEKGPHEAFCHSVLHLHSVSFSFVSYNDCLDSMSERLGRIISNAFTVSVDKHFDVCKHACENFSPGPRSLGGPAWNSIS